MNGPHRHQELVALCRVCKVEATDPCRRCGAPLCKEHGPEQDDRRCLECEGKFVARNDVLLRVAKGEKAPGRVSLAVGLAAGVYSTFAGVAMVVSLVSGSVGAAAIYGAVGVILGGIASRTVPTPAGARRKLRRRRAKFLAAGRRSKGALRDRGP